MFFSVKRAGPWLVAGALVTGAAASAVADEMIIVAGGGYRRPVNDLVQAYEAAGGPRVGQAFGNIGQITAQAKASPEVGLVCGDEAAISTLSGLKFSRFVALGTGRMVVAYRRGIVLASAADVARAAVQRIGIPDVRKAVYGIAGLQFLRRSGLLAQVQPKLIRVAMVPQVTAYLVRGEVDAGFINLTDAIGASRDLGGWVPVDPALYAPIHIACGVRDEPGAAGFIAFLQTRQAHAIEARYGM